MSRKTFGQLQPGGILQDEVGRARFSAPFDEVGGTNEASNHSGERVSPHGMLIDTAKALLINLIFMREEDATAQAICGASIA